MKLIRLTLHITYIILLCNILTPAAYAFEVPAKGYESFPREPEGAPVSKSCKLPCNCTCKPVIEGNHIKIRAHTTDEFIKHRTWMIEELFVKHIRPAMAMMTLQLSTVMVQQTQMIGTFFDAKHQLETQRLFQQLMAEAHKDYMPSEGLCEVGTLTRSLATSERKSDLSHMAFASNALQRQLRNSDKLSAVDENSDIYSRINSFIQNHCNIADNSNGLENFCKDKSITAESKADLNKDIDFTRTLDSKLTLDIDFTQTSAGTSSDEIALFALTNNLFAHDLMPEIARTTLATEQGIPRAAAYRYMDLRSVTAKRSVAQNSFTAIASERVKGDKEVAPYIKKLVTELGIKNDEVEDILGEDPSYFAQMEVLTKNIYQNPVFYTELYDKPANVLRKGATLRAINLMQERDLYKSQLRSEAVLAVILETMLLDEHNRVNAALGRISGGVE